VIGIITREFYTKKIGFKLLGDIIKVRLYRGECLYKGAQVPRHNFSHKEICWIFVFAFGSLASQK
jgi:hypothetical protein